MCSLGLPRNVEVTRRVTGVTCVTRHSLIMPAYHDKIDKDEVFKT